MDVLIVDDQKVNRSLLTALLKKQGHTILEASSAPVALGFLKHKATPTIALVDWEMPVLSGIDLCRQARSLPGSDLIYVIFVTLRDSAADIAEGFAAGANDYIKRPFNLDELVARVGVGARVLALQQALTERLVELELALGQVRQLRGMLPICGHCKKVRDDRQYWHSIEGYLEAHTDATFTHGLCPDCFEKHMVPELKAHGFSESETATLRTNFIRKTP